MATQSQVAAGFLGLRKHNEEINNVLRETGVLMEESPQAKQPGGTITTPLPGQTTPVVPPVANGPGTGGIPAIPGTGPSPVPTAPQHGLIDFVNNLLNKITNTIVDAPASLAFCGLLSPGEYTFNGKTYQVKAGEMKLSYKQSQTFAPDSVPGATDPYAVNYNPQATVSDGTEEYPFTGNPGPIDSRNTNSQAPASYVGSGFISAPLKMMAFTNSNNENESQSFWQSDGGPYGQNNAYYENPGNLAIEQQTRKGLTDEFIKSAEYRFTPPFKLFQERQNDPPHGIAADDNNMIDDFLNGNIPRNNVEIKQNIPFFFNKTKSYRGLSIYPLVVYGYVASPLYVMSGNNQTWRPGGTPPSWYTSLTGQLASNLRGCNQQNKTSTNPHIQEIFAFSDSSPLTGYSVYKNGVQQTNTAALTATYDDSGTNKITIFDFNCVTNYNPICLRARVRTLSGFGTIPALGNFITNNDIDGGKYGTFAVMQHNAIKSLNIPRPFYIEYCNAYFPAFSGRIYIQ
jgi:hypothetical protein